MRHVRHVFVCAQQRDGGGKPACGDRGGRELLRALESRILGRAETRTAVTGTLCLGPCFDGPNAVSYPDGTWYCGLEPADADALLDGALPIAKRHPWSDDDQ
jgi:(2Fe-2S) ferredoxin